MDNYRQLILIYICFLQFFIHSSTSRHPGHLKPFASSGPFEQMDELQNDFLDPILFFHNYVSKSHPILFRQVLAHDPHLSLWNNDETLNELFLNNHETVHIETQKKESRKQEILTMTMSEFLQRYQNEELYLVEEVPPTLRPYFTLPKCLQCKPALETFQVAMLWFSSGNTSSVVHTDDYDNINCVLQGDKQFILVNPNLYPDVAIEIIDNYSGSFSSIDVDRVDYDKYPSLDNPNIHYYQVNLTKGDCLFLPALWIHQVRSKDRNIAVNYWLNHERVKKAIINKNTCLLNEKTKFVTLETIHWPKDASNVESLKNFMLDLVDEDKTNFKEWTREFSKELDFDLQSNVQTITYFADLFDILDKNDNGFITYNEIESLFDTDNGEIVLNIVQDILDIVEIKVGKRNQSNDTVINNEQFYDNYRTNETLSDDEEGDGETDEDVMNSLIFILLFTIIPLIRTANQNPGHLKPFGSTGSIINIKELTGDYPTVSKLFTYYIPKSEPLVSRQVLNNDTGYSVWQTDETLLNEVYGLADRKILVDLFTPRARERIQISFREFLNRYKKEMLVYVENVPDLLQKYLVVPKPLQCETVLDTLESAMLVMSPINTSPLMFTEDQDHFHCVVRGSQRFVLVNTVKYPDVRKIAVTDKRGEPLPFVNPDRVDFDQFPFLANVEYHTAILASGDCLFIPSNWLFQERVLESTITVIYNIKHQQALNIDRRELKTCPEYDPTFTLDQVDWSTERYPSSFKDLMLNLINSKTTGFDKWQQAFSKHLSYDIGADSEVSSIFEEFYGIIDVDGNGQVTNNELEQINGAHQHHIADILYEISKIINSKRQTSTPKPLNIEDDENLYIQNYKTDL